MNRQELLTLIQLTDAELDRLLRKMGQTDFIGVDYIPEEIATQIVENYNRHQATAIPPSLPAAETPADENDEYLQAIQETTDAANQALALAAEAGATTGEQFVKTFAESFALSAAKGMGKFRQQMQQQMAAIAIHNPVAALEMESPKTLEAQAKP